MHAALEQRYAVFERQVAAFQLIDNFFQLRQLFFKVRHQSVSLRRPSTSTAAMNLLKGALTCTPCTAPRTPSSISLAIFTPSASDSSLLVVAAMRVKISSGTLSFRSLRMNSALRRLVSGQM